jgi:transposase
MKQTEPKEPPALERRKFDATYKRHAVELSLREDRPVTQLARELGISEGMLYQWRRQYAARCGPRPQSLAEAEAEIDRLRTEVARLREREIVLKKSLGILSETPGSGMPRLKR